MNLLLFLAVVPVFLLLLYVYKKDVNKEPRKLLIKIFIGGGIIFIPIVILEVIFAFFFDIYDNSNYIILFFTTFFGIGLIEEFFKWLVVYKIAFNNKEFDEVYDAIVYAVFSSLGFAFVENILYILSSAMGMSGISGLGTAILRAFTAIPIHTCDGIVMGYYLGLAKKNIIRNKPDDYLFFSLLIPVILHTIYDFLLLAGTKLSLYIWFVGCIGFIIGCAMLVRKVAKRNEKLYSEKRVIINPFFNIDK